MRLKTLIAVILITLTACAPIGPAAPTPTIMPLNRAETDSESAAQVTNRLPAPTPIPPPSPTPTRTPFPSPAVPQSTPTPVSVKPRAQVIAAGLNVRQGPGLDYPIIGTASTGDELKVTGVSPDGDWLHVVIDEQTPGWVSGLPSYVRLLAIEREELPLVEPPLPPATASASATEASTPSNTGQGLSGRLIFMTGSGGDLYVISADGSGLRRLTRGVIDPAVSPDGRQVAFMRWDGAKIAALQTVNLDGRGERTILGDIRQGKSPTWSPDGEEIIISFQHGGLVDPPEICKEFDFDDGIRLPDDVATITKSRISEDQVVICYIRREDLKWGLRRVDVVSGEFEDLAVDDYSFNPAWDPNNSWRVIYDGSKGLMQLDVNNNLLWPITTDLRDTGPVFAPDGQRLALTYRQHDHWEVYTLDLETGERRRLTKPPILADPQYNSASPAWSPDGTHLAFVTDRTGRWEIWVMKADGSQQRPLFPSELQAQLGLEYRGVNEKMLDWIE